MENGLGIFTNQEEEQIDYVDQSGYLFGPSLAATLNNIPTALHWWIEECKLLDGDSQPDCCVGVVYKLIPGLEKYRNIELNERKEKRKKQQQQGVEVKVEKTDKEDKDRTNNAESGTSAQSSEEQPLRIGARRDNSAASAVSTVEASVETTRPEDNGDEMFG